MRFEHRLTIQLKNSCLELTQEEIGDIQVKTNSHHES